ncbi:MAG: type II secretion system protein, partial [Armatimonadota bacterium]|nr:type II secretion system protein [Armatimonadota bacterium]
MRPVRAFTLVEMLMVLAIIAVLVALILGVVQLGRRYAYRGTCMSNLRQLVTALKLYDENWGGPPPFHIAYSEWDKVQPEIKPILLCPADFTRGELTPYTFDRKPRNMILSSYAPFYFLHELDCPGGWAPLPDAERMWFHCDWHSTRYTLIGFADG